MSNNRDRINYLLEQYAGHAASEEEVNELFMIIRQAEDDDFVKGRLTENLEAIEPATIYDQQKWEPVLQHVFGRNRDSKNNDGEEQEKGGKIRRLIIRFAAAAVITGLLFTAGYFIVNRKSSEEPIIAQGDKVHDVKAPDKNRAQIKLADGRVVYLDSAGNGELVDVNGVKLVKTADGAIAYEGASTSLSMTYNTLSNPRGSIVMDMTLSDGSRVWLNAGSSLTYPVAFIGNERKVSITGEAYFEVAHNASKPFIVSKGDVQVQVLGTHFNVNAYDDESEIKVTLLEGSVRVQSGVVSGESIVIKPGEQAVSTMNGQLSISKGVDVEQVMAWKNGRFQFKRTSAEVILREVARWYDVDIVYEDNSLRNAEFTGGIGRKENASEVLKMLELTGTIHFMIEGRRIVVRR